MQEKISTKFTLLFILFIFFIIFSCGYLAFEILPRYIPGFPTIPWLSKVGGIEKFNSEEDFTDYLFEIESQLGYLVSLGGARATTQTLELMAPGAAMNGKGGGPEPERISETTVQVLGIDEPDIVKTDGKEIYFSSRIDYIWRGVPLEEIAPRDWGQTKLIKAFPPSDLEIDSNIDKEGTLLLHEDVLLIFSGDEINGYDVSTPESPTKKWTIDLESNNYIVGARLYNDKVYLVTSTRIDTYRPCPIEPLSVEGVPLEIKCVDVYHPVTKVPVDVTYHAMILNPESGKVEDTVSFIGSSSSSVVYMSKNGIYITYSYFESMIKFFSNFLKEKGKDITPSWVIDKLEKLETYDISDTAKLMELQVIFERWHSSLDDDERLRIDNELENRIEDYYRDHKRELETTGIIKIALEQFEITANGAIPGIPLNQFSLDEYDEHLRIATTVGEGFFWGFGGSAESANDIYILDGNLNVTGSLQDLGLEERIYSVRFIEDKGYLVTFRQIDPFFVIDLSNHKKPELKGELKIPGYSSYLHPITKDKILGIGKEGSKVKISLFDVLQPEDPKEVDKYTLDEYWSDILNTHHAFLLDSKHKIFFLPGNKGGYIFSYENNKLELRKAVSNLQARRAIYLDDYLYIIGDNKIVVLDEINWEEVNDLDL